MTQKNRAPLPVLGKKQQPNSLVGNPPDPYLVLGGKLQRSNGNTFRRPYISVRELALAGTVVPITWRPPSLLGRTGMKSSYGARGPANLSLSTRPVERTGARVSTPNPLEQPEFGSPGHWASMVDFLKEYRGWTFELKTYRPWREGWEHDHCISCGQAIAEPGHRDDAISRAYAVSDQHPRGAEYEWLCPVCAHALAPLLDLNLLETPAT